MTYDLQPGDKVWIRDNLAVDSYYGNHAFNASMKKYCGRLVTIARIKKDYFLIREDDETWLWTWEMILPAIKNSFKVGDNVRIRPDIKSSTVYNGYETPKNFEQDYACRKARVEIRGTTKFSERETMYRCRTDSCVILDLPARLIKPVQEGEAYYKVPPDNELIKKEIVESLQKEVISSDDSAAERHLAIVTGLNELYKKKNADYGDSFHQTYLEEGMAMPRIRLSDKLNRFKTLTKNGKQKVKGESIRDTLLNLANYAILTVMELDREAAVSANGK